MIIEQTSFERDLDKILAETTKEGLWIHGHWTVAIPREDAISYVQNFGNQTQNGFYKHEGRVILSHGSAKLTLTEQEADAVVALVETSFM